MEEKGDEGTTGSSLSPQEQVAEKKKALGLDGGVELVFVEAQGKFSSKKEWHSPLPPTSLSENSDYRYLCGAFVESESQKIKAKPPKGITVIFRVFDEDGKLRLEVSNRQPYKGGYFFFEDIHLECMPWTLQLLCRLTSDDPSSLPLFQHSHIITTESGRKPLPPRPVTDDDDMEVDSDDEKGPSSRRKGHPMRTCGPKDLSLARSLLKITGKKELPKLVKKRKAVPKKRRWHLFEGVTQGLTKTVFSRALLQKELLAFMNKSNSGSSRNERRRVALPLQEQAQ